MLLDCCAGRDDVSLGDVLHFFSGCDKLPSTGFTVTPSIKFTNMDMLPRSSTCDLSIMFPRSFGLLSYNEFQEKMDMCVQESFGFGNP